MTDNQSDIVERVRAFIIIDEARSNNTVAREAADEIERLRTQIEHYEWGRKNTQLEMDEREQEIGRLRAAAHDAFMAMCSHRDTPDDEVFQDAIDALGMAAEREGGKSSEPLVHTDKDREYANDLLEDLDIKATGPQLEIATQWFCKARVEQALERGGRKS